MSVSGLLLYSFPDVVDISGLFLPPFPFLSCPVLVSNLVPFPSPSPFPPRPCSRPCSHHHSRLAFVSWSPPPFLFPPRPRPNHRFRSRSRSGSRSRSRSHPRPRPRSLLPVPRTWLPPQYNARSQTPGLANRGVGCLQASLPVCKDDDACGMKVSAVKQKTSQPKTCYFIPLRQMLGLVGVYLRPLLYPSDGELHDKDMHV